jgi:DNA-binding LacI/PurR family transcriptional regulator
MKSRHAEITEDLRERILRGDYDPGSTLPTIREFAQDYETSYFTVQTAMTPLVEEGLVERRRRAGTVVSPNIGVLTRLAIYCGHVFIDEPQYAFTRELCGQLQRHCANAGISTRFFTDMRLESEQNELLPELKDALEKRQVQGILVPLCSCNSRRSLEGAGLPIAFVQGGVPNGVGFRTRQLLDLSLGRLRDVGCRTVGLVSPDLGVTNVEGDRHSIGDMFVEKAVALGLRTEDDWVDVRIVDGRGHEAFGYDAMTTLWQREERPDGLLVYPDTVARGVTTAILEQGIRVPDDLNLVFHHNTGIDWPCPPAVDWVITDVALWAAKMIEVVQRQVQGKPEKAEILEYTFRSRDE